VVSCSNFQTPESISSCSELHFILVIFTELVSDKGVRIAALNDIEMSFSQHFDEVTDRIASHENVSLQDLDIISSAGERWSSRLFVAHMEDRGVAGQLFEADAVVVTDEVPGNARPLLPATRARVEATLLPALDRGAIPVVTGFLGASESGLLTTLGRGGTDLTAAVVGACL
jgi:bifunctional aspartokinase / homoserine dehydrogenase 1